MSREGMRSISVRIRLRADERAPRHEEQPATQHNDANWVEEDGEPVIPRASLKPAERAIE